MTTHQLELRVLKWIIENELDEESFAEARRLAQRLLEDLQKRAVSEVEYRLRRDRIWHVSRESRVRALAHYVNTGVAKAARYMAFLLAIRQWRLRGWNDEAIKKMALIIRTDGRWDETPILADALEEAGCTESFLLDVLRDVGEQQLTEEICTFL